LAARACFLIKGFTAAFFAGTIGLTAVLGFVTGLIAIFEPDYIAGLTDGLATGFLVATAFFAFNNF